MSRVVFVFVALFGATASAEPRGRIITISRDHALERVPLLCEINTDMSGTCLGTPTVGEVITVVDAASVVAEVEIAEVDRVGTCSEPLWQVKTNLRSGSLQNVHRSSAIGVSGRGAGGMRKVDEDVDAPSGNADERVVLAIDRDGDRRPDILLTRRPCDAQNRSQCIDTWLRRDTRLERVAQFNIDSCR